LNDVAEDNILGAVVIGEIHRSSRYVVSRARSAKTGANIVVKAVRAEHPDPAATFRLKQEYDLLVSLNLPGVVRPIAFEPVAGRPALILEDAGAQNLKQWLHRREISPASFLALAVQLAEALARLHGRNVLHRDINPWNVVVDQRGRATLIDFEAATAVTGQSIEVGVPARLDAELSYIAPEETGRMNRLVDQRADLYSLGVVFYEMLTGGPPFVSTDPVQLVHAHLARPPVPPVQVNPSVPAVLSDVVVRLLAKMPESRYQSAKSLFEDLREAKARLETHGAIAPFELGLVDLAEELPLPERLYQREGERAALLAAWQEVAAGETGVVVLAGAAGIGKSALANELRRGVAESNGRFLTAKFDQQQGRAPYAPLAETFRGLVLELLAQPSPVTAVWRKRIQEAVGENARALADLAPELERLIGPSLALPAVGPMETESRLHLVFQAFLRALATREHPLVLFLDDLQWADPASLRLVEELATAPDFSSLLIVVAIRPEESNGQHGVTRTLATLAETPSFRRIDLGPLDQDGVVELCADVLRCDRARALPLADLILKKTAGNPFFIRRMLRFLQQSGLLVFDAGLGEWTWDLTHIEKIDVSDNVVDLLLAVLQRLPDSAREIVKVAACIGNTVPVGLLAAVSRLSPDDAARGVWTAVRAGLLVPFDGADEAVENASFRFAHDRIRQAASLLLDDEARKRTHLQIGRQLLRDSRDAHALDEKIYAVVDQMDRGMDLISEPEERLHLSQLNLSAARKARGASTYGPALEYLKCAISLLPDDAWASHRADTFALHREAVRLAGLAGELGLADELFERTLARATSVAEKADLYNIRMYASTALTAREEAFQWGIKGLRLLGIEMPLDNPEQAAAQEIAAVDKNLEGRSPRDLLDAPLMTTPEHLVGMELLTTISDSIYFHHPELFPFVAARMVNLSLEHGNAVSSAQAYGAYGMLLMAMFQDYKRAHAFGRLSVDLAARFGEPTREMKVLAMFATGLDNLVAPLQTTIPLLQDGLARALKVGDMYFGHAFIVTEVMVRMHQGEELGQLVAPIRSGMALVRKARYRPGLEDHLVFLQAIRTLQGVPLSQEDTRLAGTNLDERGFPIATAEDSGKLPEYQVLQLGVACLFRDFGRALELSRAVAGNLVRVPRFVQHVEHNFYTSIAFAARAARASAEEREELMGAIARNQEQLGRWAQSSLENFGHKHLLVAAEVARLEGRVPAAADLYDRAITAAGRERFLHDEALANELCGRFYLAQGRKRIAGFYLSAAIEIYGRWGAKAKVDALEAEFVDVAVPPERVRAPGERAWTQDSGGVALDLLALFRAAEAVSGEVMLPKLLSKLMEVCLATAGAEHGAFVVEEEGQFFVRAVGAIGEPASLEKTPLDESSQLSGRVIHHVCRTAEPLVVGDASVHEELASDPYILAHAVRSLLALPILRQTKLMGVLYLENNLATRVFTPERVRLLTTLSSQIATSLQNSLLFEQLSQEIDERKRAEAAVRFLADAGATLAESLEYQSTLKKLTQLAVPILADWCSVHVVEGDVVHWVACAHVDPVKQAILEQNTQHHRGQGFPRHVAAAFEAQAPILHTQVDRAVLDRYVSSPEEREIVAAIGAESSMVLPLRAHGRFLGAMTLASSTPGRFGPPDVAAGEELARRAALAIDNARLYGEATEAIRVRDEFLSIASHELNTPITSLKLVSQAFEAAEAVPPLGEFRKVMNIIARQSQRLATLVRDLLDVAQIPSGDFLLRREPVDLAVLVRSTVELFRADLDRAKCGLVLAAEEGLVGEWDRSRLQQVVANLLSNAIKFAAGKQIEVTVANPAPGIARLIVEDRGIGIPPERLPHIFGRFERAVSASHYGGLGLGLYLVRAIVHALGGTVTATSTLGSGAKFTVDLPLTPSTAA
jgi:predicted ATPase/signal transduction histidine kinase